jgi:hypothetical protein
MALAITGVGGNSGIVQQTGAVAPEWLELEVVTTAPGQTYSWQIAAGADASSETDWGDGSPVVTQAGTGIRTNTYAAAGTYVVRIKVSFTSDGNMNLRPLADRTRLRQILGPIPAFPGLINLANFINGCSGLTSLPADLLRYVFGVTTLNNFCRNCSGLTSIPPDLLRYVTAVTNFSYFMTGCTQLQLRPDLFGPNPETFFATRTPDFSNAFYNVGTLAGTPQGTAPPLWTYTYGGAPTTDGCFALNSATNLSNWAQIPIAWGGPA